MSHPFRRVKAMYYEPERIRISGRLKNALIADLVVEADTVGADRLLLGGVSNDEHDWTSHLGRQLGMPTTYVPHGGVHDTLMVLIPELDILLQNWPLNTDSRTCTTLARAATKSLNDVEVYATLLAGPPSWRRSPVGADCKVEKLAAHLSETLERALASGLSQMLQKWSEWDVRGLRGRWQDAKDRGTKLEAERRAVTRAQPRSTTPAGRKRIPPPPNVDRAKELQGYFQPKGRT